MKDYAAQFQQEIAAVRDAWQAGYNEGFAKGQAASPDGPEGPASAELPKGVTTMMLSTEPQAFNAGWYIGYHDGYTAYKERNDSQN